MDIRNYISLGFVLTRRSLEQVDQGTQSFGHDGGNGQGVFGAIRLTKGAAQRFSDERREGEYHEHAA